MKANNLKKVRLLLDNKSVDEKTKNDDGFLALCAAAMHGRTEIAQKLLENIAVKYLSETIGEHHEVPLHLAAWSGHKEMVQLLLEWADKNNIKDYINIKDINGNQALHKAAWCNHCNIAELLLECGAELNSKNNFLQTPYKCALKEIPSWGKYRQEEVADLLMKYIKSPVTKADGIFMHTIDCIKAEEYVYEVGKLIGPQNITMYSKMDNGLIRIYLKNELFVNQIAYRTIKIGNNDVLIRPLEMKSTRIIILNALPQIPHQLIIQELTKLGYKPISINNSHSRMTFLKAGLKRPNYEDISISSHRYIDVAGDFFPLLRTMTLMYEGSEHKIFIADSATYCNQNSTLPIENVEETIHFEPNLPVKTEQSNTPKRQAALTSSAEDETEGKRLRKSPENTN